jgi:biuret amidohydrolase
LLVTSMMGIVPAAEPYPWPYDDKVSTTHLALLACGWDTTWVGRVVAPDEPGHQVVRLADAVAAHGGHIFTLRHPGLGGQPPAGLPLDGAESVACAGVDGFWGSALEASLRRRHVTHLLVVGHGLEAPVHSTMRSANDRGYECLLVVDACSAIAPEILDRSLSMIHMSGGIFGATASTADTLAALGSA